MQVVRIVCTEILPETNMTLTIAGREPVERDVTLSLMLLRSHLMIWFTVFEARLTKNTQKTTITKVHGKIGPTGLKV